MQAPDNAGRWLSPSPARSSLTPNQRQQAARLFAALAFGERLAHDCARRQSVLVACDRSRRFLRAQARQEMMHARLFEQAVAALAPGGKVAEPAALRAFGRRLEQALERDDLSESLVASQVVLEGIGEQILVRLNHGLDRQGVGFARMRRMILRQEQSHHAFGLRMLQAQLGHSKAELARLGELAGGYLEQVQRILGEMSDVFAALDEDVDEYLVALNASLPAWVRS